MPYGASGAQDARNDARLRSDSLTSASAHGYNGLETIASESDYHSGGKSMGRSASGYIGQPASSVASFGPSSGAVLAGSSSQHTPSPNGVVDYSQNTPGTARWERTLWKKLEVGDIVLLRENDQVPADIVLLNSSDPDGNAFVETKNLDGETNLKARKCVKATMGIQTEEDIEHARFTIDSEPPHANLYAYNALLKYHAGGSREEYDVEDASRGAPVARPGEKVEPITTNELLLRGCALRNTEWVIGIVVFTGADTKASCLCVAVQRGPD
jgi:phospholipid-translocating ATPase